MTQSVQTSQLLSLVAQLLEQCTHEQSDCGSKDGNYAQTRRHVISLAMANLATVAAKGPTCQHQRPIMSTAKAPFLSSNHLEESYLYWTPFSFLPASPQKTPLFKGLQSFQTFYVVFHIPSCQNRASFYSKRNMGVSPWP